MSTTAIDARGVAPAGMDAGANADRGAKRVVAIAASVCALHVGVFVLAASDQAVRVASAPPPRIVTAELIERGPAPVVPHANQRAAPASHPAQVATTASRPPVAARVPSRMHDTPTTPQPAARVTPSDRQSISPGSPNDALRDVAPPAAAPTTAAATEQGQAQAPTTEKTTVQASSPAPPRFVAHPACTLVKPDYPPQSLRVGEHGTVVVELDTDATGRVLAARVATSSGHARLDAAAREAVLASRCAPHEENGTAVPTRARAPITFNLDE